jgi:hypothetical protein
MDCHLAQVLKIFAFGFQGDNPDLTLKRFKQLSKIIECFLSLFSNFGSPLARAAMQYGAGRSQMERERDNMNQIFGTQVADPLQAMGTRASLEDVRQLTNRHKALRQDVEVQATKVGKRMVRNKETAGSNPENTLKLQIAKQKLGELSASMVVLGNEAVAAMTTVETQQQRLTLQRLTAMVETEHSYYQRVAEILDELLAQMIS